MDGWIDGFTVGLEGARRTWHDKELVHAVRYPELKDVPFQLQSHFTKLNGMKCVRVISKTQPVTTHRSVRCSAPLTC